MEEQTKWCYKCGETKSVGEFSKSKSRKDGLQSKCKECESVCKAVYNAEHKEKIAVRKAIYRAEHKKELSVKGATYYQEHKEEIALRHAIYNEEHKEELAIYNAIYYTTHKEDKAIWGAAWKKANPDKVRANNHRRRAKKKANGGTHTAKDIQHQCDMQGWMCWWGGPGCTGYCKDGYHVDHIIPLSKGGTNWPDNIVISCPHCNCSKKDKLPEDWISRWLETRGVFDEKNDTSKKVK